MGDIKKNMNHNELDDEPDVFLYDLHATYMKRCLQVVPSCLSTQDISRLTIAFFAISGLDLLGRLNLIEGEKDEIIEWIYSLQILALTKHSDEKGHHGFRGATCNAKDHFYDCGNLAMTYCALASLIILGDDLERVDKLAIINGLKHHQQPDGSFIPVVFEKENDMRFVYCVSAICFILQDWSGIDLESAVNFIGNSLTYESAFGQGPGFEAHGGSTYCAIASLSLMNQIETTLTPTQIASLKRWCLLKQSSGFQGRPNKDCDTCYSFWIGAALKLLDSYQLVNHDSNLKFILSTQDHVTGGLSKYPDSIPDPLHSYLGIGGLALKCDPNLSLLPIDPALNISERASRHLQHLHSTWSCSR